MFRPKLCLWFCFNSLCLWTVSFLYVLVLDENISLMLRPATPGFLRAGDSSANFANFCLLCNYDVIWTGMSSCLGFLLRRDSWHPQQLCILSMII
jgi:hypothetical protein